MNGYAILRDRKNATLGTGFRLRLNERKRRLQFFLSRCIYKHVEVKNET